jgi:hypothetical protein
MRNISPNGQMNLVRKVSTNPMMSRKRKRAKWKVYRKMMGETEDGYLENFWVDGISFEAMEEEAAI